MQEIESHVCHGGLQKVFSHSSSALKAPMRFGIFLPPQAREENCPVLYWLSGLTCSEQNFICKSGFQKKAAALGLIVINPDTSARVDFEGNSVANSSDWMLGQGASFYINAQKDPWKKHYQMFDYVSQELPELVEDFFPIKKNCRGIGGHSMGGHGALLCALKRPFFYQSLSALAPICSAKTSPFSKKAFEAYLGADPSNWDLWDVCSLISKNPQEKLPCLVHQGDQDEFYPQHLESSRLIKACQQVGYPLDFRLQEGYDHSFYFISSFIDEHLEHHIKQLLV